MPIYIRNKQKKLKINTSKVRRTVNKILALLDLVGKEVSVLLVDNESIREINKKYLGRDTATNVISFAMAEGLHGSVNPALIGDIVISVEKALTDSRRSGMPMEDEIDFLLLHGILHLIGYEHEIDETGAQRMKAKERELFFSLKRYSIE